MQSPGENRFLLPQLRSNVFPTPHCESQKMTDTAPETIYLKDYTPFGFIVDSVHLTFDLDPHKTRVTSRIAFRPNPEANDHRFFLHGENLTLISAQIDGVPVTPETVAHG